ncbi:MAG: Cna B-type domain-containing protein [Lachnospiraceae bacterium]|nr:Cna B-type domain-containing protein [Lachnospiraceae bacterium]
MKVQLNSGGSSSKDNIDIIVTSYDVDGTPNDTKSIDVTAGTTVYDITVEARYGEKIEVVVEGTQHLPTGAYFYQPEPSDRNGDGKFTSKETSQNLIGVSMGDTAVRASAVITDTEIPENKPETADLYIQKNNGSGESLAGAEFDLYKVSDTQTYNIGTFSVDSNGSLAIAGLLKGNYELKETKAPDGYSVSRGKVAFEVTAEDTIVFTQIDEAIQNLISTKDSTVTVRNEANTFVSVSKVWVEDRAVVRPTEIKVQLLKNGNAEGAPVVLNDSNGWKYTWNNLDRYDNWSVKEIDVPSGYTTTYANTGNVDNGYVCEITNTLIPEDKTFVAVNKVWKDDVEANRPTSIQVQLLKDGVAEGAEITLSKENNWTYTWTDLVKSATWTVEEINVPTNYKASVSGTGNQYTITNTYEEPETTTSYVDDDDDEPTPKTTAPAETTPAPTETTPVPTETVPEPTVVYRGVEIPRSILDAYPGRTLDELFDMGVLGAYFENVPTGLLPATSDINPFWMILMVISMIGLAVTSVLDKKRNN